MKLKVIASLVLTLFLMGILTLAFNIQTVKAYGTIYIRADGSIDPPTAPISSVDNVTYTFTGNINDSIVVERDNIVVDGAGYTLQSTEAPSFPPPPSPSMGILTGRSNVTIKNIEIKAFWYGVWLGGGSSNNTISGNNITANKEYGIYLFSSNNNTISGNIVANTGAGIIRIVGAGIYIYWSSNYNTISGSNITNNWHGIDLSYSSNNNVFGNNIENNQHGIGLWRSSNNTVFANNIKANKGDGIGLDFSSNNSIVGNNIVNNRDGVRLHDSSNSSISGNNITANNEAGIFLSTKSSNNVIYHNNFVNNRNQLNTYPLINVWDNGYPSGGNYWSDYRGVDKYSGPYQNETGSDGIGDTPYVIDANNRDRYPLMGPSPAEAFPMWIVGVAVATIAVSAVAIAVFWRKRKQPPHR